MSQMLGTGLDERMWSSNRAQAARVRGDCVVQDVPEPGELRARWHAQRRNKRALQSNAEQAPPAAQPALGSGPAQGSRSALNTKPQELSDKAERFRTPASASFAREDA